MCWRCFHLCCCHAVHAVQVSLLLDQADQYDEAANAALKGIRAEPQQPELPRLRQALTTVKKVLLLAESQDVSRLNCFAFAVIAVVAVLAQKRRVYT